MPALQTFLQKITESYKRTELIKIILGNKKDKSATLKNVLIKPVLIKNTGHLSFTYRHNTQDIVKNYLAGEAVKVLQVLLQNNFNNADAFTQTSNLQLSFAGSAFKLKTKPASLAGTAQTLQHDRVKQLKTTADAPYLHQLDITTADGQVKKDMQDKFRQISHYIEIIDGIIKNHIKGPALSVADMGCGKGYLTFALYDHLTNAKQLNTTMYGVEMRQDLVNKCNAIARKIHFSNLHFIEGTIQDAALPPTDMLIALHACDTATDDAIYKGIKNNAQFIVVAPCCHKQIRKQMAPDNVLKTITQHGILLERQAEMVTDTIRALLLEAHGYKTKVFDFISTEHTPKNVMIAAVKGKGDQVDQAELLKKVTALKQLFGIEYHYLEKLLQTI
ncbi:MAG: SAM-dependent methyltransferase [Ferruginibacter sp.]